MVQNVFFSVFYQVFLSRFQGRIKDESCKKKIFFFLIFVHIDLHVIKTDAYVTLDFYFDSLDGSAVVALT